MFEVAAYTEHPDAGGVVEAFVFNKKSDAVADVVRLHHAGYWVEVFGDDGERVSGPFHPEEPIHYILGVCLVAARAHMPVFDIGSLK